MKPKTIMLIAGEASGDVLAAELVRALRTALPAAEGQASTEPQPRHTNLAPRFFGAGGPCMAENGVDVCLDLTAHSVVGLSDVLRNYSHFKRFFQQLLQLAVTRQPDAIIGVDYSGFNLRFAEAVRRHCGSLRGTFANWNPALIQYVSPQVWASRAGRVAKMERCLDLVLSIFPFEKEWYAKRAPNLGVEFIGHPLVDRYAAPAGRGQGGTARVSDAEKTGGSRDEALPAPQKPLVILLPGSRPAELRRHLPVMAQTLQVLSRKMAVQHKVILPNQVLLEAARGLSGSSELQLQVGGLAPGLAEADLAIASTGTVTMECAWFGVPTVALYKSSWSNYQIGRRIIKVRFLSMPNILVDELIFPEFIQEQASPETMACAALELLTDKARREHIRSKLAEIRSSLGPPGASHRAAQAIADLLSRRGLVNLKAALVS